MRTNATARVVALWAAAITLPACNGQAHEGNAATVAPADTPHVEVQVNKQYDEHGNLIAYDSSYVRIHSHGTGDPATMDSLFRDFRTPFGQRFPFLNDPAFDRLFFSDPDTSGLFRDFFRDDFFRKRMELNQQHMDRMMHEMDSLKNEWFHHRAMPPPKDSGTI